MTAGDTKRQVAPVREYYLEACVRVYPNRDGRWLCEDHLGRVRAFPTEALANDYAEATIGDWQRYVSENP